MDVEADFVDLPVLGFTVLACLVADHTVSHTLGQVDGGLASGEALTGGEKETCG